MSLDAYTANTWVDYADSPCLEAVELNRIDSGIAAVTAELLALEAALPTTYQPISAELSALAALSSTGYAKRSGAAAWSVVSSIPQADVSGLTTALAGKEPTLGSPSTSGYLLSSTTAGVRSWVAPYTHPATHPQSVVDSASGWITTALAGKQAAGSYALADHLHAGVYQPVGNYSLVGHGHAISEVTGLQTALDGKQVAGSYENALGNPGTSGYLLSSTTAGVRSWVAPYTHPATHPQSVVDSASGWITTALAGKQATITTGITAQYLRGDLSLATFPTTWAGTALTGLVPDTNIASAAAWNAKQAGSSVLTSIAAQSSGTGLLKLTAGVASLDSSVYALAASVPLASSTTPAALGTAAVGTGATWARADHVHTMPTAAQVGARANIYPVPGNFWNGTPTVGPDGVMEIGKYIDFHATAAATSDFDVRLTAGVGTLDVGGALTRSGYAVWDAGNLIGTRNEHNHEGTYLPLAGGTMSGNINLNKFSITSGSTSLGDGMVSSIGGNFTNLQVVSLFPATGFSYINLGANLVPSTDSRVNLGQDDKRLLATYSVYSYLSYLDASAEVAGPVMRWKNRIVIGSGGVLPIVGDGCAIIAVGQGSGPVTNKPTTNNYQAVSYRKSDGTIATAAAGGNVIDLDLYGRCAFIVGVSSSQAQLIL